jgi:hypothetical protein
MRAWDWHFGVAAICNPIHLETDPHHAIMCSIFDGAASLALAQPFPFLLTL